jgi:dipeptidyl aminopeptidase/acylaminoacyl peptidase
VIEGANVGTLRLLTTDEVPEGHAGEVFACSYSPDGALVVSAGWDGALRGWDAGSGMSLVSISAAAKPLSACAVTPDGKSWWAGSMEGMLTAWDPASQTPLWTFMAHTRPISAIRFAPDGQTLATTSWDRQVALRKTGKEREPRVLAGHTDIVAGCCFAAGGRQLLSWSYDGTVRLWDVTTGREVALLGDHGTRVTAGDVSPDGHWAVTGGMDGNLKLWSLTDLAEADAAVLPAEVRGLFHLSDGSSFVAVNADGLLTLLSAPNFEVHDQLALEVKTQCGALAPLADQLALGGDDGRVRFVAVEGFEETAVPVTVAQGVRVTSTGLDRLFGRTRSLPTYRFACPACRQETEGTGAAPAGEFACPACGRRLRVAGTMPQMQPQ